MFTLSNQRLTTALKKEIQPFVTSWSRGSIALLGISAVWTATTVVLMETFVAEVCFFFFSDFFKLIFNLIWSFQDGGCCSPGWVLLFCFGNLKVSTVWDFFIIGRTVFVWMMGVVDVVQTGVYVMVNRGLEGSKFFFAISTGCCCEPWAFCVIPFPATHWTFLAGFYNYFRILWLLPQLPVKKERKKRKGKKKHFTYIYLRPIHRECLLSTRWISLLLV